MSPSHSEQFQKTQLVDVFWFALPTRLYIYVYVSVYINKYNNTSYQHIWDSHCICNRSLSPSTIASIISSAFLNISEYFCSSAGHWRQEHRPGVGPGAPHRSGEARRCRCQDQVPGGRGNVWVKCGGPEGDLLCRDSRNG